jgi:hypothetical protein
MGQIRALSTGPYRQCKSLNAQIKAFREMGMFRVLFVRLSVQVSIAE